jgi:hypothetical protein
VILGDFLDAPVLGTDGTRLGYVVDVRLALDGPLDGLLAAPRLHGLLIGRRTETSFLGYERTGVNAPAVLARWFAWRQRGTFLVHWEDVASVTPEGVRLRAGFRRLAPDLPGGRVQRP